MKIILAANIAKSSITIPDVKYVVNCGFVKVKAYDVEKGFDRMIVVLSGSSMIQSWKSKENFYGKCYIISTEVVYVGMPEKILPEI